MNSRTRLSGPQIQYYTCFVLYICALTGGITCNTPTENEESPKTIAILSPLKGMIFDTSDTVLIISESDYTQFSGGLTIEASNDSSKTWEFVWSLMAKTGIAKDTFAWIPLETFSSSVLLNRGVLIRMSDYNNKFITQSEMIFFNNCNF